jgi:hypothetical protein
MKISLSVILIALASAATAEQMECYGFNYRYEDRFLKSDQILELYESDIEWRDFCSKKGISSELTIDYPIAECKSVSKYEFRMNLVSLKIGSRYTAEVEWRNAAGQANAWKEYDFVKPLPSPFDISEILAKFGELPEEFLHKPFNWTTLVYTSHTLNFDVKRQQFKSLYSTVSEIGEDFQINGTPSAFECK